MLLGIFIKLLLRGWCFLVVESYVRVLKFWVRRIRIMEMRGEFLYFYYGDGNGRREVFFCF